LLQSPSTSSSNSGGGGAGDVMFVTGAAVNQPNDINNNKQIKASSASATPNPNHQQQQQSVVMVFPMASLSRIQQHNGDVQQHQSSLSVLKIPTTSMSTFSSTVSDAATFPHPQRQKTLFNVHNGTIASHGRHQHGCLL